MRKLRIILAMLVLFGITAFSNKVFALTSSDLISVGSGKYAITVSSDTTIEEISRVLGEPKVYTDSAFGGHAYTFYTDSDYNNYLYIETTNEEKIISFGSVDPTYETNTYSYGDSYNYRENGALHGCLFNNNSVVEGGVYYNKNALINRNVSATINEFKNNYNSNPPHYLRGISEHSVAMYNALSTRLGNKTELVFNEEFFYINEQLKESGTSIRSYLGVMDKGNYMKAIGIRENIELSNSSYYLLNPMMFASLAKDNKSTSFGDKNIAVFDYDIDKKLITAITVGPDVFEEKSIVDLTTEELGKLSAGRAEYVEAIKNLNLESDLYDVLPQSTEVTTLTAGVLKDSKKEGITDYINAIRAAAGLPKLKINEDAFLVAQHISTLISYRYTELGLEITHVPAQPDGLSDEYYKIAVGYGRGYAENLGYSATSSTASIMMYHINLFLDDSSENPQNFSHRSKIIDPEYTGWGYGISPYTFSNEFSGYKASDVFLKAWPAEGVTFLESLVSRRFYWTAQFIDKYKITDSTTVTVKCLNTGDTWNFTTEEDAGSRKFKRYTTAISSLNNKVVFYDNTIYPEQGYVYQITLHNILDEDTNATTEYTYRSVFDYADVNSYPTTSDKIGIEVPDDLKRAEENKEVYFVPVEEEVKLKAVIDDSVSDKKVTWVSSNDKVKVTQNGTVIAQELLDEDVTISVSYDGSNVTAQVILRPYNKIEQVKLEPDFVSLTKDTDKNSGQIHVTYLPEDANEDTEITWKIISCKNESIEYDINDSYITQYIKLEVLDSATIKVTAIDAESNNNKYKIKAYVEGISGIYTGTTTVEINVPLLRMDITGTGLSFTSSGVGEPKYCTINYNDYYNSKGTNIFELDVSFDPKNSTVEKSVSWNVTDGKDVVSIENGQFRIDKEGTAKIIATQENGVGGTVEAILYLTINSNLESMTIEGSSSNINLEYNNGKYTASDKITVYNKYPEIDSSKIEFRSSNTNIATVDEDGNVSFVGGTGEVIIFAESDGITSSYKYEVNIPIETMDLPNVLGTTQTIKKGEEIKNKVTYSPSNASCKDKITYSSSNSSVASVDSNGVVTAKSCGTATITATIDAKYTKYGNPITLSYIVEVVSPVESISTVNSLTLNIEEGSKDANVTINPSDNSDSVTTRWESSNTNVLTIDSYSGKITPIKTGRATVTVTVTATNSSGTTTFKSNISVIVKSVNDPDYLKGDLDRNGVVNANDAAVALDLYKYNNASSEDILIGDIDENGVINANDAALILDIYKYGK